MSHGSGSGQRQKDQVILAWTICIITVRMHTSFA